MNCEACGTRLGSGGPYSTWCRYCDEEICSWCASMWEDGADGAVRATCRDCAGVRAALELA